MTRIRQWLASLALAAVLMLSFASVASADPIDPGTGFSSTCASSTEYGEDDDGSKKRGFSAQSDPIDPGTGP
jgi:hypothetical protein